MTNRIGFCCKWLDDRGTTDDKTRNTKTTTVAWLNRQTREVAEQRLWDLMVHNIAATHNLIKTVGEMDAPLRMVRVGSDILPVYTEPSWSYFWKQPSVKDYCEKSFSKMGDMARTLGVRLSMHPGQFVVLASGNPEIVERSIAEFEYHVDMIRWMGFGQQFQDFKCNVHISGLRGPDGIREALNKMSPEARNTITIENEEYKYGIDDCLSLADIMPTVLDVHHHWIRDGSYIASDDVRIARIIDSWRGVRPVLHYSVSRESLLRESGDVLEHVLPEINQLLESGHKKADLRAHSDFYWNSAVNDYVLQFADRFDIQCESKAKNLASTALYAYQKSRNF